ncbi:MAG: DUF1329 domain-containing protein [Opitutales bacterium]
MAALLVSAMSAASPRLGQLPELPRAQFPDAYQQRLSAARRLSRDLTPMGAERAGNGLDIPPWRGGLRMPPPGYAGPGQPRIDPFAEDQVYAEISYANWREFSDWLSPGLQQLFSQYPDTFRMRVLPSRRSAAAPDFIYDQQYLNQIRAELDPESGAVHFAAAGVPFPVATEGLEMVWNHLSRWRGFGYQAQVRHYLVTQEKRQFERWRVWEAFPGNQPSVVRPGRDRPLLVRRFF